MDSSAQSPQQQQQKHLNQRNSHSKRHQRNHTHSSHMLTINANTMPRKYHHQPNSLVKLAFLSSVAFALLSLSYMSRHHTRIITASNTDDVPTIKRSAPANGEFHHPHLQQQQQKQILSGSSNNNDEYNNHVQGGGGGGIALTDVSLQREEESELTAETETTKTKETAATRTKTPRLYLLLSFPNSGTTYTLETVEHMTHNASSTATNYGTEFLEDFGMTTLFPVLPIDLPHGPFFYHTPSTTSSRSKSPRVLVKSHCGGYCDDCPPFTSLLSVADFERLCGRLVVPSPTTTNNNNKGTTMMISPPPPQNDYYYDAFDVADKVVHLLRHPLDNMVARMHRGIRKRKKLGWTQEALAPFRDTREGFHAWCRHIDDRFLYYSYSTNTNTKTDTTTNKEKRTLFRAQDFGLPRELDELTPKVPCVSDLIRYVTWHNHAVQVTSSNKNMPLHILYYEDYSSSLNRTISDLMEFMGLDPVNDPLPFVAQGKTYHHELFSVEEARAAAQLVRLLATPNAWPLLRPYVVPWLLEQQQPQEPQMQQETAPPAQGLLPEATNTTTTTSINNEQDEEEVSIVWLMSFPNSGTSYTITNTMKMSRASTATNYGHEASQAARDNKDAGRVVPLLPKSAPDGPYLLNPNLGLPSSKLILTKTHCTAYCDGCRLLDQLSSLERFEQGCRETTVGDFPYWKLVVNKQYPSKTNPKKAVHMWRHPYNNLVARKHLGVKRRGESSKALVGIGSKILLNSTFEAMVKSDTVLGLHTWCRYLDDLFEKQGDTQHFLGFTEKVRQRFAKVPCYSEIFRWIHWHNMALEVTDRMGIPVHHMFYEDYTTRFNEAVDELNDFLQLPVVEDPIPFQTGKTYLHLFNDDEIRATAELARFLASVQTWYYMRRYFEGYYKPSNGKDRLADLYGKMQRTPAIVLLISFPNSGTSYTIANVQRATRTSAATNTASETKNETAILAPSDMPYGPFLLEPEEGKPVHYILTKSHCAESSFNRSVSQLLDLQTFEEACRTTTMTRNNGEMVASVYNATVPQKFVHLFRNPFDNIVSRMHMGIQTRKKERWGWAQDSFTGLSDSKEGLMAWCRIEDSKFGSDPSYFPEPARGVFASVPCYSEVFRYVQWHNLALQMINKYGVPTHTIFHEDYAADYDKTLGDLLKFIEAERTNEEHKEELIPGSRQEYRKLFKRSHRRGTAHLVRLLASPECWSRLKRYFPDEFEGDEEKTIE